MKKMTLQKMIIIPGKTIDLEIKARGLNQKEIAARLNISEKHLIDLIKGETSITPEMALKLEYVFGISMGMRLNMDRKYQEQKARIQEQEQLAQEIHMAKNYASNIKHLFELGHITSKKLSVLDLIKELKSFFSVSRLSSISDIYKSMIPGFDKSVACYRKTDKFKFDEYSLFTFLRIGELDVLKQNVSSFEKSDKKELILQLKQLTKEPQPDLHKIREILNQNGIYFSFLPKNLDKLPVNGLVRYYKDNPLLQLTGRGKYTDIFWFNLFHELGHIYKHLKKKDAFLDGEHVTGSVDSEEEANEFANDMLIDKNDYELLKKNLTLDSIIKTAKKNDVYLGIVIARLAHDRILGRSGSEKIRTKVVE